MATVAPASTIVIYKLLALDLDGTLVRRDGSVHADDLAAIGKLQASGIAVTIATGRLYSGSRDVARLAKMIGPIACVDGSHIVHTDGDRDLHHHTLSGAHAELLRSVIERHEAASFLFAQDAIVHDARGDSFAPYVRTWSPNITVVERMTAHPYWEHERGILAVVAVGPEANIEAIAAEVRGCLNDVALVVSFPISRYGGLFGLIVRALGSTKGTAVEWLAAHYGCSPAEVVAVGDWLNDVPMFKVAGRSFAMGQAPESVKQHATDRLRAENATGGAIAEAIASVWGRV